jgi:hypothetical protein
MLERIRNGALATIVVLALAIGGSEAVAGAVGPAQDCSEGNWCAASRGGLQNCIDCCDTIENTMCTTMAETELQGCICG